MPVRGRESAESGKRKAREEKEMAKMGVLEGMGERAGDTSQC